MIVAHIFLLSLSSKEKKCFHAKDSFDFIVLRAFDGV